MLNQYFSSCFGIMNLKKKKKEHQLQIKSSPTAGNVISQIVNEKGKKPLRDLENTSVVSVVLFFGI